MEKVTGWLNKNYSSNDNKTLTIHEEDVLY